MMGLLSLVMLVAGVSDAMDVPNQLAESTMALLESRDGCVMGYPSREKLITISSVLCIMQYLVSSGCCLTDASSVFWHDCTCKDT